MIGGLCIVILLLVLFLKIERDDRIYWQAETNRCRQRLYDEWDRQRNLKDSADWWKEAD